MSTDDTTAPPQGPPPGYATGAGALPPIATLRRSRADRKLAGVAGGLGRYFAVDPVIFRIGFAVSIFFGGLGVLAYAVLFLFVPSEPAEGEEEAVAPIQRSGWLRVALGIVVVLAAMSAIGSLVFWDGNWGDRFWGVGWLAIVALLAAAAYSYLRDRDRPVRGGALLAAIALAVRCQAPIFAAEEVIEESSIEFEHEVEDQEEVVEKFKDFLDNVTPEDFASGEGEQQ